MRLKSYISAVLAVMTMIAVACKDDTVKPGGGPPESVDARQQVILNIEKAYNQRRIDSLDQALDANFTFYLATGDVGNGLPESWDRVEEVYVNSRLFDKNYAVLPAQSIFMDIRTENGVKWIESNPESAPDETWYSATLYYNFKFEISPNTYIPNQGSKAVFTVRDAGTPTAHHWQLVEIRDLGGSSSLRAAAAATEPTTWGSVKALYR